MRLVCLANERVSDYYRYSRGDSYYRTLGDRCACGEKSGCTDMHDGSETLSRWFRGSSYGSELPIRAVSDSRDNHFEQWHESLYLRRARNRFTRAHLSGRT